MSAARRAFVLKVTVERVASNEADGWVPDAEDVATEIRERMVGRDLDTGWDIVGVRPDHEAVRD